MLMLLEVEGSENGQNGIGGVGQELEIWKKNGK
jgi:hypothetical protein